MIVKYYDEERFHRLILTAASKGSVYSMGRGASGYGRGTSFRHSTNDGDGDGKGGTMLGVNPYWTYNNGNGYGQGGSKYARQIV